jgi:hypothetical protein
MLGGGLSHLIHCREMDEAVGEIDGSTPKNAFPFGLAPLALRYYLVDRGHRTLVADAGPYRNSGTKQWPNAFMLGEIRRLICV